MWPQNWKNILLCTSTNNLISGCLSWRAWLYAIIAFKHYFVILPQHLAVEQNKYTSQGTAAGDQPQQSPEARLWWTEYPGKTSYPWERKGYLQPRAGVLCGKESLGEHSLSCQWLKLFVSKITLESWTKPRGQGSRAVTGRMVSGWDQFLCHTLCSPMCLLAKPAPERLWQLGWGNTPLAKPVACSKCGIESSWTEEQIELWCWTR